MGNIGRSSTGCFLCRRRKIKCDERKEGGCRKCEQVKKKCPGYPFMLELTVNIGDDGAATALTPPLPQIPTHASTTTIMKAENLQPVKHSTIPSPPKDTSLIKCDCATSERMLDLIPRYTSPTPPPKYDIHHQSTCFFLHLFCYQATQAYGAPILDYLPDMLAKCHPESCINQATRAVSQVTLADRYSGHDVRLDSSKDYVQALSITHTTIRDKDQAVKDETVVAVWLLGLYEAINSVLLHGTSAKEHRTAEEEWQSHISHIRGALNLFRMKGESSFETPRSEKIYRIFKAAIQMRLFMLNSVTSTDFDGLEQDIYQDEHEFLPSKTAIRATDYFHAIARLIERIKYALRGQIPSQKVTDDDLIVRALIKEGEGLDAGMTNWSKDEAGWDMMKIEKGSEMTAWSQHPAHAVYWCRNFWVYLYHLRYLIARIKLFESLAKVAKRQNELGNAKGRRSSSAGHFDFKISQYRTIVQLTAGQIIGLTAYALGDVTNTGFIRTSTGMSSEGENSKEVNVIGAMQLVIPLKVLQRSDIPTATQKKAIDLALLEIGKGFGRQPR